MEYYLICPEVPGGFGEKTVFDKSVIPWEVIHFHLSIDGWLGGDLLTTTPLYYVTEVLMKSLRESALSGIYQMDEIEITKSDTYRGLHPNKEYPRMFRLRFSGIYGKDDFCWSLPDRLLISDRALTFLQRFNLSISSIEKFKL